MAKPALILVGADKGGVGKTTVARTLLDYFTAHQVATRAFDTETPKGTLKRFHRDVSEIVDVTTVADQMRIIDTLSTTDASVTVVDVRAGLMSPTLHALRDIGFLEAVKKGQITFRAGGKPVSTFPDHALMAFEADQCAHRHAEFSDFVGTAEIRQIDDEAGSQDVGAELL
jgi:hypothetical protein